MYRYRLILLLLLLPATLHAQPDTPPVELSSGRHHVKVSTDVLSIGMTAATFAGLALARDWQGLKQGALSVGTTLAATYLLKYTVRKERPDGSDRHAFPSNHSALSFATAAVLQRRYGWALGAPAYALSAYVAWGRVYARRHDWLDVACGAAIGIGAAYIYTRPFARRHDLCIAPATDGRHYLLSASWTF